MNMLIHFKHLFHYRFHFYFCNMESRLEAHYQNRTYYFQIIEKKPDIVSISMYNTLYSFIPVGERWENHKHNKMDMAGGLIAAILASIGVI